MEQDNFVPGVSLEKERIVYESANDKSNEQYRANY